MTTNAGARAEILDRLRATCRSEHALFHRGPLIQGEAGSPSAVTHAAGDGLALARLFGEKLRAISGSYELAQGPTEAWERVKARVLSWHSEDGGQGTEGPAKVIQIMSWVPEELPIPRLDANLRQAGIELIVPGDIHDRDDRLRCAHIAIGLTGVDAAFAATGTLAFAAATGRSRVVSLMPRRHIALVPFSRIHATPEAWLGALRSAGQLVGLLRGSRQLVFVTGPSKTADIEQNLTVGVHGPRSVHAVLFDDA